MVGHLGAESLAGLAIAATLLQTVIGLMIFLAYATTPLVARKVGAGDHSGAMAAGLSSVMIAAVIGVVLAFGGWIFGQEVVMLFQPEPAVAQAAETYFRISMLGVPAMLMVLAATGLVRGFQDTKTPLYISVSGFGLNILLNYVLIYVFEFGIAGSAWGLVAVQWLMIVAFAVVLLRQIRIDSLNPGISVGTVVANLKVGGWLFLRTITLRIALLMTITIATGLGTAELATYQIIFTFYSIAAFALDALAIAAQAMIGKAIGAEDEVLAVIILKRCLYWGIVSGTVVGVLLAAVSPVIGVLFSTDATVLNLAPWPLVILGLSMPLGGYVFVLDGVLMGSGDVRYLALAGLYAFLVYVPILFLVKVLEIPGPLGLMALTAAFTIGYMAARALTLGLRISSGKWLRVT